MSIIRDTDQLLPSILDRLIDHEPSIREEAPSSRSQILFELKQSVRRDLENLLNTRWKCVHWPPDYEQLELSLVNYGIPDFSGVNMGGPDNQKRLIQIVERAIDYFEPRFARFSLVEKRNRDSFDRTLRFKIDGLLKAEPSPEPVSFDTSLDVHSAEFEVK
ncbi:MAG: type VI secretion system baseplate subunit TssE [Planctomycetota bacterium]